MTSSYIIENTKASRDMSDAKVDATSRMCGINCVTL